MVKNSLIELMITTTFGTGELIRAAISQGCTRLILGIGGSATNDGGTGMAKALGYRFLDQEGQELEPGGGALKQLARIEVSSQDPQLKEFEIIAACDVTNPLTGPMGASLVYGPQKGATQGMALELDQALENLAAVIQRDLGIAVADLPGAGAAGGLGAGLVAFTNARLQRGVEVVLETVGIFRKREGCRSGDYGGRLPGRSDYPWQDSLWGRPGGQSIRNTRFSGSRSIGRRLGEGV